MPKPEMTIRPKPVYMIMLNLVLLAGFYLVLRSGNWGLIDWFSLAAAPFLFSATVFVIPSLRMVFYEGGITVHVHARHVVFPSRQRIETHIRWQHVEHVFSIFPHWIPLTLVGVKARVGEGYAIFFIGFYFSEKERALIYIASHVDPTLFDQNTARIVSTYKERADA